MEKLAWKKNNQSYFNRTQKQGSQLSLVQVHTLVAIFMLIPLKNLFSRRRQIHQSITNFLQAEKSSSKLVPVYKKPQMFQRTARFEHYYCFFPPITPINSLRQYVSRSLQPIHYNSTQNSSNKAAVGFFSSSFTKLETAAFIFLNHYEEYPVKHFLPTSCTKSDVKGPKTYNNNADRESSEVLEVERIALQNHSHIQYLRDRYNVARPHQEAPSGSRGSEELASLCTLDLSQRSSPVLEIAWREKCKTYFKAMYSTQSLSNSKTVEIQGTKVQMVLSSVLFVCFLLSSCTKT